MHVLWHWLLKFEKKTNKKKHSYIFSSLWLQDTEVKFTTIAPLITINPKRSPTGIKTQLPKKKDIFFEGSILFYSAIDLFHSSEGYRWPSWYFAAERFSDTLFGRGQESQQRPSQGADCRRARRRRSLRNQWKITVRDSCEGSPCFDATTLWR